MPIETTRTTHVTAPVATSHTEYKVEDDRSFGEKAKDAIKDAAHSVKEAFTPEVKDKDIAKAEMKHQELRQKEEMDRRLAEGANAQQAQLQSHAEHLQDKQFAHREEELHHAQKADKQAEKVAHLQNKQAEQQADKCAQATRCHGVCPNTGEVKVTRVTETH